MQVKESDLKKIFSKMFEVDEGAIDDSSSMSTVDGWDSMKHIMLVFAVEEAFGITFDVDESVEMTSYPAIKKALRAHDVIVA